MISRDDFTHKLAEADAHAGDLAAARDTQAARHAALVQAQQDADAADAAVAADGTTLDADRKELHAMIDALYASVP